MKKKPIIITVVIVAAAAILIGGGIYLYPHLVERTVSQVVGNDMADIVKISLNDRNVGNKVIEVTDKEDIEEIVGLVKDLKVKKKFDQSDKYVGGGLWITMTTSEGEKISLASWKEINGVKYKFLASSDDLMDIYIYIAKKYDLRDWPEEEMEQDIVE